MNNYMKLNLGNEYPNIDNTFSYIYPFTTENIDGYIRDFDLNNKSLLTVGSSSDQVINSAYFNCNNQTVIDVCPFTKYYFYLKKAALLELKYNEFLSYFCYKNYPTAFVDNKNAFNKETFKRIQGLLKELDYDSFIFWFNLYLNMNPLEIRTNLFSMDEDKIKTLIKINTYLKDKHSFNETKDKIRDVNPTFICDDIFKTDIKDKFDNIWFSNIGAYNSVEKMKKLVEKFDNNLNINGKMLICYLYTTVKDTKYSKEWASIYNLDKTNEMLGNYITDFISFQGVKGILHEDEDWKDSVLIYKKTK